MHTIKGHLRNTHTFSNIYSVTEIQSRFRFASRKKIHLCLNIVLGTFMSFREKAFPGERIRRVMQKMPVFEGPGRKQETGERAGTIPKAPVGQRGGMLLSWIYFRARAVSVCMCACACVRDCDCVFNCAYWLFSCEGVWVSCG